MASPPAPADEDGAQSPSSSSSDSSSSSSSSSSDSTRKENTPKPNHAPTTPKRPRPSASKTPKTVPTASGPAAAPGRPRRASQSQKAQPTLLTDFFLGRPTQARVNAQRRKSMDANAVKAEMRSAMRQSSVQRLQPPNGVKNRVKAWQKSNIAAMTQGSPEVAPSEPTDVAFGPEAESVTEADRLRIRARKAAAAKRASAASGEKEKASKTDVEDLDDENDRDNSKGAKPGPKHYTTVKVVKKKTGPGISTPPPKRIVSDQHWMKRRAKTSPKARNPKLAPLGGPSAPIPKDFLQRTARNPTVQNKIKDWAQRVEPPSPQTPRQPGRAKRPAQPQDDDDWSSEGKTEATSWRSAPGEGIRVRPLRSTRSAEEKRTGHQPAARNKAPEQREPFDDGIRIRPIRPKPTRESTGAKDKETSPPPKRGAAIDDGIRVRPLRPQATREATRKRSTQLSPDNDDSTVRMSGARSSHSQTTYLGPATSKSDGSSFARTQHTHDDEESTVHSPSPKPRSQRRSPRARPRRPLARRNPSPTETRTEDAPTRTGTSHGDSEDSRSWSGDDSVGSHSDSYGPSTVPPKSLAEIPVGFSAFSELDLPVRGEAGRGRTRTSRNPSFKGVPNVLKKVVNEGKKIIQDKVDPPRPVANKPPSIEKWLKGTVDPFVETAPVQEPAPLRKESVRNQHSVEEQWKKDAIRRSTSGTPKRGDQSSPTPVSRGVHRAASRERDGRSPSLSEKSRGVNSAVKGDSPRTAVPRAATASPAENAEVAPAAEPETPKKDTATTPTATPKTSDSLTPKVTSGGGLKRSGATRSTSSPIKPGSGKKPFREVLRDAFRGESSFMPPRASDGPFSDTSTELSGPPVPRKEESSIYQGSSRRSSSGSSRSDTLTELTASVVPTTISGSSDATSSFVSSATPSSYIPRRRPPPTSGGHQLSTIASVETFSTRPSDALSSISESTVTQGTTISKTTANPSRQRSQKSTTNLKRRLTKHSDLISVLSLPEDSQLPARTRSIRLARSLHRKTSKLDNASIDDLLQEFTEDENIYRRELKTLVRGVVPVLLTQFTRGKDNTSVAMDVFRADIFNQKIADAMAKAVVNMGVALEKMSLLHEFVPLHDAARMVRWLETAYPVYDNYLDVWRLGFQGIIVNLAPAAGKSPEEDSLINGMDRNEDGDVLDENGERVDVAYLLRRPLVRIKWMLKFSKGVDILLGQAVAGPVVSKMSALSDKARRRNREETARKTDEDAAFTDTTRARDLRSLAILDNVHIDQTRQVAAKDWFELSLAHSNGQRLECQVELVYRDKISDPSDRGDVLVRETGGGGRTWLLFPPIAMSQISARRGDGQRSLVVMVRDGGSSGSDWYELLMLTADHDDTPGDWISILGTNPTPPTATSRRLVSTQRVEEADVPVGERKLQDTGALGSSPKTPSRYHHQKAPSTPTVRTTPPSSNDNTPSGVPSHMRSSSDYKNRSDTSSRLLREDMRPDPLQLKKASQKQAVQEDEAPPPPPAHRTIGPKAAPILSAPAARIRRRTSSPLKHEFHASDVSSESDSTSRSSGSESDSSSADELEEDDVPDTLPGISIKNPDYGIPGSVVSDSSLTPSNSASQAGLPGLRGLQASFASKDNLHLIASISYWSNRRGAWKDLGEPFSTILVAPGLLEAYSPGSAVTSTQRGPGLGPSKVELASGETRPLIALDLTPLVMIRQSTVVDLEIRSPVRSYAKYNHLDASIFRFRAQSPADLVDLYTAVHQARMNNAKFRALEEEARFRSFGQSQTNVDAGDDTSSRRRRTWFGRKNSYRASTRAPSQSQGSTSTMSATSFLRKLTSGGNTAFNIHGSSVDRQGRAGSGGGAGGGGSSFYTSSGSSSAGGGLLAFTAPRSPSVSLAESGGYGVKALGSNNIKARCHLQTSANKWEDHGNCLLTIARPPPGVRQELSIYHGLEKRVLAVSIPKKSSEKPLVVVDVVVGSACFSRLAARGIVLNVWEEMRDENNRVGSAPSTGALSGRVRKWCFQFSSAAEAGWVYGLVSSEVQIV